MASRYGGQMFNYQRGILPITSLLLGFCLIAYSVFSGASVLQRFLLDLMDSGAWQTPSGLITLLLLLATFGVIVALGIALAGIFPGIRLTRQGIRYKYLMFLGGTVKWPAVEKVVSLHQLHGFVAIAVTLSHASLLSKIALLPNYLYGLLLGFEQPVILLAPGLRQRDKIIEEILKNGSASGNR
jgi:hypothetical protein